MTHHHLSSINGTYHGHSPKTPIYWLLQIEIFKTIYKDGLCSYYDTHIHIHNYPSLIFQLYPKEEA